MAAFPTEVSELDRGWIWRTRPVVILLGPTAVGKSQVALHLAQALGTEIIAADSRQVYRGMDIAVDKPTSEERRRVPHCLLDVVEPDQPFNVGEYRRRALVEIDRLYHAQKLPLVVGGTGLYIRSLVNGLWEGPEADWKFRRGLEEEARREGAAKLFRRLAGVDPESAARVHEHDLVKIIRALEVHHLSGQALSLAHRRHASEKRVFSVLQIGLMRERESLYRRADDRVDLLLAKGLVGETGRLLEQGYGRYLGSMKGLGYRQIAGYLAGEYSLEEAVRRLKRDTRHYVKRQLTWFRKEAGIEWFWIGEDETAMDTAGRLVRRVRAFVREQSGHEAGN